MAGGSLHPAQTHPVGGLSQAEAERRLAQYGPNQLEKKRGSPLPRLMLRQVSHPLALLLWAASFLALIAGAQAISLAIVLIVVLNALFAFWEESQAERAVQALQSYMPPLCQVIRDNQTFEIQVSQIVPGDVLLLQEGDLVGADAHLLEGQLEIDMSTLSGESLPVQRTAGQPSVPGGPLERTDMVFSGSTVLGGQAQVRVLATGMHSQIGRIAALSGGIDIQPSPLELQVRRLAWIIALVAIILGVAFMPVAVGIAGLSIGEAGVFAVALLVGNVPEGLLPIITLSLAIGAKSLAKRNAIVKKLSAVETLGSTTVICTDKTGTLTQNRMKVHRLWSKDKQEMLQVASFCSTADPDAPGGDPTEKAILEEAARYRVPFSVAQRESSQVSRFAFDATLRRMSTINQTEEGIWINCKGAPETVFPLCKTVPLEAHTRVEQYTREGLRVLAVARRLHKEGLLPATQEEAERNLVLLGLIALEDPPRPEVLAATQACKKAGIRIIMITGDHGLTARSIAKQVGILEKEEECRIITGEKIETLPDQELSEILKVREPIIFSRSSPQAKLRIADLLRKEGEVVAMTGDGANDAPALRRAQIGIAMGRSGTDVARESATMILSDDNFATIVQAIRSGRQVFQNVRKFVFYILAHTTPEILPIMIFALSGGAIPLPLPIPMLLAFDIGTEIFPALALGREPAEPGIMKKPPRDPGESVISRGLLPRAWLFLGLWSALLACGGFFWTLWQGGWTLGEEVGDRLYKEATTMTLAGMIACQVGVAWAARSETSLLKEIGFWTNRSLLVGIALELSIAAAMIYLPPMQDLLGTTVLSWKQILFLLPFPLLVWGLDEARKRHIKN